MKKTRTTSDLMTRGEVCTALGIAKTTLRRWEADGKVTPIVNSKNHRLFRKEDVRALGGTSSATQACGGGSDGKLAAKVFAALDEGVHPVELVKQLEVHPDVVESLQRQWARMRGAFVVPPKIVRSIEQLEGWDGDIPIRDAEHLFENLRDTFAAGPRTCSKCEKAAATTCFPCARDRVQVALAREAREMRVAARRRASRERHRTVERHATADEREVIGGVVAPPSEDDAADGEWPAPSGARDPLGATGSGTHRAPHAPDVHRARSAIVADADAVAGQVQDARSTPAR